MTIINLNGAARVPCQCGNWLRHWQNFSVLPLPSRCPVTGCREKPEAGVLMQRGDVNDAGWYVVPLCKQHGQSQAALEISSFTTFVSANISETCDRH